MARILIVEDDPINAEMAAVICRANRHTVTVVENGVLALLALDAEEFDLILTDVVMPRMDGITLTGLIRASEASYANMPIVGMTALAGQRDLQLMMDVGMDHVVTKPFRNSALLRVVEDMLLRSHADVQIFRMSGSEAAYDSMPRAD